MFGIFELLELSSQARLRSPWPIAREHRVGDDRSPVEHNRDLAHALMPLELAVLLVRDKFYGANSVGGAIGKSDPDAIAILIAASVTVYEYTDDPAVRPHELKHGNSKGVFRKAGGKCTLSTVVQ
jgi:hypothetical protein